MSSARSSLRHLKKPWLLNLRPALVGLAVVAVVAVALAIGWAAYRPYPSDHTPEGAYLRIARHVTQEHENQAFAYLETDAQWACFSIRDTRKSALELILKHFPKEQQERLRVDYERFAKAPDGADIFALFARERKWNVRLRKDLSGVQKVEVQGERATVVTTRGTRYSFRKRDNGIWGMTLFTTDLVAESERAARDLAEIKKASEDYARVDGR